MTLKDLEIGDIARIDTVGGEGALRQHFLDMGVIPGVEAKVIKFAPMGDPMEIQVHGYELTLRLDDATNIEVTKIEERKSEELVSKKDKEIKKKSVHPALGEPGIHHKKESGKKMPLQGTLRRLRYTCQ